jgi:hypothetical protein
MSLIEFEKPGAPSKHCNICGEQVPSGTYHWHPSEKQAKMCLKGYRIVYEKEVSAPRDNGYF